MPNKITSTVVLSEDGESYWQPGVRGNCVTIKISPWNIPQTKHTVFLHELPKGGQIGEHAHDVNEEIFICLDGEGVITIDGIDHRFVRHAVAYISPMNKHKICNTGDDTLKFMVVISPTGLEDRLKLMGIAKMSCDEIAPEYVSPEFGKLKTHGVI